MSNNETNQLLQRLVGLNIVETPKEKTELGKRECYSLDSKNYKMVPATPSSGGLGKFQTDLKKRRKNKLNRVYAYEADKNFIKARKSLNF
ncbi:protein Z600 [Drosophila bipectinata]|uniref:protein Z600 n=1 Tax=Drosophila bipectinata TaxID=42026 RepID=UPI001C8AF8D2|nr:protein Z600 [Drosophila bipectinata]